MIKYAHIDLVSQAHSSWVFFVVFLAVAFFFGGLFPFGIAFLVAIGAGVLERKFWNKRLEAAPKGSAVVVTGCSSGFGLALATRLAESGVTVFAGVRKDADGEKVKAACKSPNNIHPVILDVAKADQVTSATEEIEASLKSSGNKLLALVNNAGYGEYGPVECMPIDSMRSQMEVNVFGLVNLTQKIIPLLRKYGPSGPLRPRIVNMSSGNGKLSLPGGGVYSSSKFCLEALTEALRVELMPWDIRVILVEPGRFQTGFTGRAYTSKNVSKDANLDENVASHYIARMEEYNEHHAKLHTVPTVHCVKVIEDALLDTKPLPRYLAGTDVQWGIPVATTMPDTIRDMLLGGRWKKL
mmetsp:Transcript_2843/g.9989  ORF Transcript_2843/g.9989 Transcript_2843/m.9989 type:complete len:354 (-) Transcript_2843:99-1160(-)